MSETKPSTLTPQDEITQSLAKMEPDFKKSLPPQIPSAKFIRVAQTAIRQNPDLAGLNRASLYGAFHKCAADGLIPDGREAAIVTFGQEAVYMPMIQGICKKARNSGEIKSLSAHIVYKNDMYEHWIDEMGEHFKHVPARGDRGDILLAYAFCQTKDEGVFFEEMDLVQLTAVENASKQKGGPWKGPFKAEMMKKSVLRRLLKYRVPSSTDLDDLIRKDDELYDLKNGPKQVKPAEKTSSRLKDIVSTTSEPAGVMETPQEGPTEAQEAEELRVAAGEQLPI